MTEDSSSGDRGLDAGGIYVPTGRLPGEEIAEAWETARLGGIDRIAVPAADEDALTMAIAAAERTIEAGSIERGEIDHLFCATTTPPLAEGEYAGRMARALGLRSGVATTLFSGSTAAGGQAIGRALEASGHAVVAVADCPTGDPGEPDRAFGAGGAAAIVTDDAAVPIVDVGWHADDRPGVRFRPRGDEATRSLGITGYERTAIRECVTAAIECLDVPIEAASGAALHQPSASYPGRIAATIDLANGAIERGTVIDRIGDAGAATVPIGLLVALSEADRDEVTIGACFGGGTAVSIGCEGRLDVVGTRDLDDGNDLTYAAYLRRKGIVGEGEVAGGGANVSTPSWQRSLETRYRLVAGRCPACGGFTFPPRGACQHCHERVEFDRVRTDRSGTVLAVTTIAGGAAPPEFEPQQRRDGAYGVGIVSVDAGDDSVRVPAQLTTTELSIGDRVRATLRRLYTQESVPRYGVKFAPID